MTDTGHNTIRTRVIKIARRGTKKIPNKTHCRQRSTFMHINYRPKPPWCSSHLLPGWKLTSHLAEICTSLEIHIAGKHSRKLPMAQSVVLHRRLYKLIVKAVLEKITGPGYTSLSALCHTMKHRYQTSILQNPAFVQSLKKAEEKEKEEEILTLIIAALLSLVSWTNGLMTAGKSRDCCLGKAPTRCGGIVVQWAKWQAADVLICSPVMLPSHFLNREPVLICCWVKRYQARVTTSTKLKHARAKPVASSSTSAVRAVQWGIKTVKWMFVHCHYICKVMTLDSTLSTVSKI